MLPDYHDCCEIFREQLNKMKSNEVEKGSEPPFSNLKQSEECSSGSIIQFQFSFSFSLVYYLARISYTS